jgi:DNA-binding CsgD family transcriptional regulator
MKQTIKKDYRVGRIAELSAQGKSRKEIAEDLGIKLRSLHDYCYVYGIKIPTIASQRIEARKNLVARYAGEGFSREEIAQALGIRLKQLIDWASDHKVDLPYSSIRRSRMTPNLVTIQMHVPTSLADEFQKEANSRNVGCGLFAASLLSSVIKDKLYNAVLDQI